MTSSNEPVVKYMAFYPSYYETINLLPAEKRLSAYEIFLDYGLYGIAPDDSIDYELKLIFSMAKATIDSNKRNIINGSKGGRPKKEDSENEEKTPVKTPVKTKKEKEKDKEKEKEMENIPFTYPYPLKEGDTPSPSADAGEASTFTLTECKECAAKGKVNLTEDGIQAFYDRMEKDSWKIKGTRVENLLKAMRGFAKNHKQYQKQEAESSKTFKEWLQYHGYDQDYNYGDGDFDAEVPVSEEAINIVWKVEDLNEKPPLISRRLADNKVDKVEFKQFSLLFKKWKNGE